MFSLLTQKHNIDIIKIVDSVEFTKNNYERLRKKLEKNPEYVFELSTLKMVIGEIESNNKDGELIDQNQKVQYYSREKMFIKNHCVEIVDAIINCYEKRYGNLFKSELNPTINANSDQGDAILFEVCRVLNYNLWAINQMEINDDDPSEIYFIQCGALLRIFERYKQMKSFDGYDEDDVSHSFLSIVRNALRYFDVHKIEPVKFWSTILSLTKEHADWKPTTLFIEICLCASFSNAILERFFTQMNLIETTLRNRLTNESLNSILRIRINGISLQVFHDSYLKSCVDFWFNSKNWHVSQQKRKLYRKRENQRKRLCNFTIAELSTDSRSTSCTESDNENIF